MGTILTYRGLAQVEAYSDAIRADVSKKSFGDALRDLGVTRLSFWVQRDPDASLVRWEGTEIDSVLQRYETSSNRELARWRGLLRVFSGPEEAESYWDASRHRIFSWASQNGESEQREIKVFPATDDIEALSALYRDIQNDPGLLSDFERIRMDQGFTRIEAWTQEIAGEVLLLNLFEAHNLDSAYSSIEAEHHDLDRRIMKTRRTALKGPPLRSVPAGKLIADWRA